MASFVDGDKENTPPRSESDSGSTRRELLELTDLGGGTPRSRRRWEELRSQVRYRSGQERPSTTPRSPRRETNYRVRFNLDEDPYYSEEQANQRSVGSDDEDLQQCVDEIDEMGHDVRLLHLRVSRLEIVVERLKLRQIESDWSSSSERDAIQ